MVRSPAAPIPLPRVSNTRDRLVWDEELTALLRRAGHHHRLAIMIARGTGLRLGEVAALRRPDVRTDASSPHVVVRSSKNGDQRTVRLPGALKESLESWLRSHAGTDIIPISANGLSASLARIFRDAGLHDARAHDLRHSWATARWFKERNWALLRAEGGWRTDKYCLRYLRIHPARLDETESRLLGPLDDL